MNVASKTYNNFGPVLCIKSEYIFKDTLKSHGGIWDPFSKVWHLPYTQEVWQSLCLAMPLEGDDEVLRDLAAVNEMPDFTIIPEAPPMPIKDDIAPFQHQQAAYASAMNLFLEVGKSSTSSGYALLFEQGCGKSLTAVAIAGELYKQRLIDKALVIAPLAVCPVWPREFADYADFDVSVSILEGSKAKKIDSLQDLLSHGTGLKVAAINYESVWRIEKEIHNFRPSLVICDESQRIKDPMSKQSKAVHILGDHARFKLILTGTPVANSPLDFFSQYRFLDRSVFGDSWYAFRARYAITNQEINHSTGRKYSRIVGYQHLDELVSKAHSIATRVTKEQALDLPEQLDQILYCYLEPTARKAYIELCKSSIAELEQGLAVSTRHIVTRLLRLSQIAGGFVRTDIDGYEEQSGAGEIVQISQAKLKLFEETLSDLLSSDKKIVVFARFTAEINAIVDITAKLVGSDGYRLIDGRVPGSQRGQAVADFQNDPDVKVFIAQIQTAGLGITLTAADTAIFYSTDYSYAAYEQAKARIHRIGQKHPCTYIHLLAKDTIDEDVQEALKHKANIADLCVDNWRKLLKGEYHDRTC